MSITLRIKGPAKAAKRAAARAGVPIRVAETYKGVVTAHAPCASHGRVLRWLGTKAGTVKPTRGYPPGELLTFTSLCALDGVRRHARRR
jgi:hypothetical protein